MAHAFAHVVLSSSSFFPLPIHAWVVTRMWSVGPLTDESVGGAVCTTLWHEGGKRVFVISRLYCHPTIPAQPIVAATSRVVRIRKQSVRKKVAATHTAPTACAENRRKVYVRTNLNLFLTLLLIFLASRAPRPKGSSPQGALRPLQPPCPWAACVGTSPSTDRIRIPKTTLGRLAVRNTWALDGAKAAA